MRADKFFSERFGSRTKAQEALKKGLVIKNGKAVSPDDNVLEGDSFFFVPPKEEYVSNGGYKLARALNVFHETVEGEIFADFGASTGGFTDCLLKHGAKFVYCIDVGERQLHPTLACDPRVFCMDQTNVRYLNGSEFSYPLDGVVSDLSFISLKLILPAVFRCLPEHGRAFLLFKPQFECGKAALGKGGICPRKYHQDLLSDFYQTSCDTGLYPQNIVNAPYHQRKNIEYLILLKKNSQPIPKMKFLNGMNTLYEETFSIS